MVVEKDRGPKIISREQIPEYIAHGWRVYLYIGEGAVWVMKGE